MQNVLVRGRNGERGPLALGRDAKLGQERRGALTSGRGAERDTEGHTVSTPGWGAEQFPNPARDSEQGPGFMMVL